MPHMQRVRLAQRSHQQSSPNQPIDLFPAPLLIEESASSRSHSLCLIRVPPPPPPFSFSFFLREILVHIIIIINQQSTINHCPPCILDCTSYTFIFNPSLSPCVCSICPSSRLISRSMNSRRDSTAKIASGRSWRRRTGPTSL